MSTGVYNNVDGVLVELTQAEVDAIPSVSESELKLRDLRITRNAMLAQSDWVVIKEREEGGSVSNFADWKTYRQALRDVTKTYKSLEDVKWPTAPTE
tara:strand:- start:39 stop:329 length:291 start_codon:yes stop_codon:yes gene_type:complete